ncbi:MAG TPA: hypothetical protein PLS00_14080 [Niabella sp.]|nr:hypothetical protein [Niabella sp.]
MDNATKLLILPSVKGVDEIVRGISTPVEFTKGDFNKVKFRFRDNGVEILHAGVDLKEFSFVWLSSFWESRDLAYAIKLYLDFHKVRHTYVEKSTSKITDQVEFSLNSISSPNTVFIDSAKLEDYVEKIEETCGYPLIVKDTKGSQGKFSAFVENREQLMDQHKNLPAHRKYFFQQFIANEYDWGVLIANGEIVSAEKSFPSKDEFRNNACNGAKEVFVDVSEIPQRVKDIALEAARALKLSWSRVDIIVDKVTNIPYIMEINRSPGVTSGTTEIAGAQMFINAQLGLL